MRYTLAVTSCNRFGLLQKTLETFLQKADVLPEATVIVEDSDQAQPEFLNHSFYRGLGKGKWITNGKRRGQMLSIDRLYDEVKTPYVFHLEDDWEFKTSGFMVPSFRILENNPFISSVSLRGTDCNGHPLSRMGVLTIQQPGWQNGWGGYSFNPGLRRMSNLKVFGGSFGRFVGYGNHGCEDERKISQRMLDLGYRTAVLALDPHIKHLGGKASRAIEPLPDPPRILLAVPAAHLYDYGKHMQGINRVTSGRVQAVRDTWFKDVALFPNVDARFFLGSPWPEDHTYPFNGSRTGEIGQGDEVWLHSPDEYARLPEKIKHICSYARDRDYDYLVKCDDDTALYVDRLLRSGFDQVEQMGHFNCAPGHTRCSCYVTGMCYTLSRRLFSLVADAPVTHWAEDLHVGSVIRNAGIKPVHNAGWVPARGAEHYVRFPLPLNTVAAHSVRPDDMRKWYAGIKPAAV